MAGQGRMTIEDVVQRVLRDERADVIRESVRAVAAELMEAEVSALIGAERGERRPEDRATHRNGYRPRRWGTRAGEIELQIPKLSRGGVAPARLGIGRVREPRSTLADRSVLGGEDPQRRRAAVREPGARQGPRQDARTGRADHPRLPPGPGMTPRAVAEIERLRRRTHQPARRSTEEVIAA
jgi:Transposase, Mutator family